MKVLICSEQDCNIGLYVHYKRQEGGFVFEVLCVLATTGETVRFVDEIRVWESVFFTLQTYPKIKEIVQTYVHLYFLRMDIIEIK